MASLPSISKTGNNDQTTRTRTASATEPQQLGTPTSALTISTIKPSANTMAEMKIEKFTSTTNTNKFLTSNPPLTFHRHTRKNRVYYTSAHQTSLRNSLLSLVGFLELANACDFAANVFNDIPVPTFAAALMGIGGCVALFFAAVAIQDARLSWRNIRLLRDERRILLDLLHHAPAPNLDAEKATSPKTALKVYNNVNQFELLTEIIDRFLMDVTMGFGATLVGAGTLMAIGGANPRVFKASNLLSGYIGNSPAAAYGILRAFWSIYVWRRSSRHQSAARRQAVQPGRPFFQRYTRVKVYAFLAGPTSLVAGAASMITATMWEGYTVLVPCIVLSWVCNFLYRRQIGYTRPLFLLDGQCACSDDEKDGQRVAGSEFLQQFSLDKLLEELDQTSVLKKALELEGARQKRKTSSRTSQDTEQAESKIEEGVDCSVEQMSAHRVIHLLTTLGLVEKFFKHLLSSISTTASKDTGLASFTLSTILPDQTSSRITIPNPQSVLSNLVSSLPMRFGNTLSPPEENDDEVEKDSLPPQQMQVQALNLARSVLSTHGALHATYRERYLIEFTGCWIHHLNEEQNQKV
ncbi:hypothetical protein PV11_04142 [Exophiala sideris]|uniref:Integral membrane protein n=1 Tax=Exophiala sideris TaxID=1016849 RepID=A0A0D1X396_9EURO|nr:hypothetical protein PV11_04142 [Exophiala sideris]